MSAGDRREAARRSDAGCVIGSARRSIGRPIVGRALPDVRAVSVTAWLIAGVIGGCAGSGGSGTLPAPPVAYTAFSDPIPVTISGYSGDAMEPFISKDGQYLFFNNRNDPAVDTNLYYASRIDDQTFTFLGPLPGVNSAALDAVASLDTLGNFYFVSTRSYATTLSTLYSGRFDASGVTGVGLVAGVSRQQNGIVNFDAEISADGQTLWFDDGQFSASGTLQSASIVTATRNGSTFVRDPGAPTLLAAVNASGLNYAPSISVDGLELFFTRVDSTTSGATPAIYRTSRPDTNTAFASPQLVSAASGFVEAPSLSADGHLLYFHKLVNGTYVIYCLER